MKDCPPSKKMPAGKKGPVVKKEAPKKAPPFPPKKKK